MICGVIRISVGFDRYHPPRICSVQPTLPDSGCRPGTISRRRIFTLLVLVHFSTWLRCPGGILILCPTLSDDVSIEDKGKYFKTS